MPQSYLRSLRLFAADVSQTLDLGLQLLRLRGDLLDSLSHLLTLLMDLVTLPEQQVGFWKVNLRIFMQNPSYTSYFLRTTCGSFKK